MMSMLSGQKNTRKKKVAEDLLLLLEAFGQRRLPSTRDLSRIFSVSQSTAMGALRLIAGKGVVELKPCARSRLQGNQPKNERSVWAESSSSQTLYCELVAAISEGIYSTNTTLPKLQFFALKYHMSVNTVRKVYRRLMAEGLVTSQGKRFIVGQLSKVSRVSVRSRPSILIVGRAVNPWRLWSENKRIHDFFEVFGREAQRLNTRLLIVTTKETSRHASIAAAGINAALQLIQELGSDYSGCLILGDRMSIPDLADWAQVLSHHRQPAVWFDRNDEGRQAGICAGVVSLPLL